MKYGSRIIGVFLFVFAFVGWGVCSGQTVNEQATPIVADLPITGPDIEVFVQGDCPGGLCRIKPAKAVRETVSGAAKSLRSVMGCPCGCGQVGCNCQGVVERQVNKVRTVRNRVNALRFYRMFRR